VTAKFKRDLSSVSVASLIITSTCVADSDIYNASYAY